MTITNKRKKELQNPLHEEKFCQECGEKMFRFFAEAENVQVQHYNGLDGTTYRLASPYDENGERNYAEIHQCPQYKRRFLLGGNGHDIYGWFNGEKFYPHNL